MANSKIKLSSFLNFIHFTILLNSVGAIILQAQHNFGVSTSSAFKDVSPGVVSFIIASFIIIRIGYKTFLAVKIPFALAGSCSALLKISIFNLFGLLKKMKGNILVSTPYELYEKLSVAIA